MNTEYKLIATNKQARQLVRALKRAIKEADEAGEAKYARAVLERMTSSGPWGLTIGVLPAEGINSR